MNCHSLLTTRNSCSYDIFCMQHGVCDSCRHLCTLLVRACSVLCQQKTVKRAYYTICDQCAQEQGVCAKCGRGGMDVVDR